MDFASQRCARAYSLSFSPSRTAGGSGGAARGKGTSLSGIVIGVLTTAGIGDAISGDGMLASFSSCSGGTEACDLAAISDSNGAVEAAGAGAGVVGIATGR